MALKQISPSKEKTDRTTCPKCGGEAVYIDGKFVRWLTCTKCNFKKLFKREDYKKIKVTPLK